MKVKWRSDHDPMFGTPPEWVPGSSRYLKGGTGLAKVWARNSLDVLVRTDLCDHQPGVGGVPPTPINWSEAL
jgi:hypothetical protein